MGTFTALPKLKERLNTPQYSFTVPKTYKEDPEGKTNERILESYITGDPNDDIPDILCSIEDLGGMIKKQDIDHMLKGRTGITTRKMKWKRHEINVVRVEENIQGIEVLTFNAQIPLIPRAIQVKLSGLKQIESELEKELKSILLRIDGRSNW